MIGFKKSIRIKTLNRDLVIKAYSYYDLFEILYSLALAKQNGNYSKINKYASFAPERPKASCEFYIDGENYFKDVYEAIDSAQNMIFICDWWLYPKLYLLRGEDQVYDDKNPGRVDQLLLKKAKQGVKIFIIVYREIRLTLNIDSEWT